MTRMIVLFGTPWVVLVFSALTLPTWRYLLVLGSALMLVLVARMEHP